MQDGSSEYESVILDLTVNHPSYPMVKCLGDQSMTGKRWTGIAEFPWTHCQVMSPWF